MLSSSLVIRQDPGRVLALLGLVVLGYSFASFFLRFSITMMLWLTGPPPG